MPAPRLRIGLVDTGVNPWHSHVGGAVRGCRLLSDNGAIRETADFQDPVGHGTAVAGVLREGLSDAELFAVRVFDDDGATYPSLVARGVLRAAAEGCALVNLSLGLPPGRGSSLLAEACGAALAAGCVLVASADPDRPDWLPAALPGVFSVTADDGLAFGKVEHSPAFPFWLRAPGRPRDLEGRSRDTNLWGHSFACARALVHLAARVYGRS